MELASLIKQKVDDLVATTGFLAVTLAARASSSVLDAIQVEIAQPKPFSASPWVKSPPSPERNARNNTRRPPAPIHAGVLAAGLVRIRRLAREETGSFRGIPLQPDRWDYDCPR